MVKSYFNYPFLNLLPPGEIAFTLETIKGICVQSPIPQLLEEITQVFSDKTYGLAESILSGKGYRYPHEIDNQRFCAEEALKNYILANALKVPALYCKTDNFKQRGMAHDIVLVPEGDGLYMMDWGRVMPVQLKGKALHDLKGNLLSSKISSFKDEEVFARVKKFRQKRRLLDFFDTPQLLSRTTREYGEADETLVWDPNKRELQFSTQVTNFEFELRTYRTKKVKVYDKSTHRTQEWGCASTPIRKETPARRENVPFWNSLSPDQQLALSLGSAYYLLVEGPTHNHKNVTDSSQHDTLLSILRDNTKSDDAIIRQVCKGHLDFYRALKAKNSPLAAARYIDILAFKAGMESEGKNKSRCINHLLGVSSPSDVEKRIRTTLLQAQKRYYDPREEELESALVALARRA